jgi:hypothetical protein
MEGKGYRIEPGWQGSPDPFVGRIAAAWAVSEPVEPAAAGRAGYPPAPPPDPTILRNPAMTRLLAALSLALLVACGGPTPAQLETDAQAALSKGDHAKAIELASQGLATGGVAQDKARSWQFERIRLEALAGQGNATEVLASLTRLTTGYGDQLKADFYAKLGKAVNDAGKPVEALDIVEAGKKKFPDMSKAFDGLVADIKARAAATGDDAATAKLKALGYL